MIRLFLIIVFLSVVSSDFLFSQATKDKKEDNMKPDAAELFNEGNDLMDVGDLTGAVERYDRALKIDDDYRIFYQRGIAQKKAKLYQEAHDSFEKSLQLNPDFELAYNALGSVEFALKDYQGAIEHFEKFKAATTNTTFKKTADEAISHAYLKLGTEEIENGNTQSAMNHFKKSLQNYNNDAAYLMLARVYVDNQQYQQAIDAANNALKYKKTISDGGPHYYLGLAYKNLGNNAKARENFTLSAKDNTYKKLAEYELTQAK